MEQRVRRDRFDRYEVCRSDGDHYNMPPEGVIRLHVHPSGSTPLLSEPPWLVTFFCPCGCGAEVMLRTNTIERPSWNVSVNSDNTITLTPSVHDPGRCGSHYTVTNNRISWID